MSLASSPRRSDRFSFRNAWRTRSHTSLAVSSLRMGFLRAISEDFIDLEMHGIAPIEPAPEIKTVLYSKGHEFSRGSVLALESAHRA